ncbi:FHA domain-containing protein [Nocardiopsis salina]|uniref:FHA domain-containing protein n=1 Tax=Nocardiopsis salina TaxID=245836 RepID=UPI00034B7E52|nr:FHA domain-containing protein [Nocardiopsis salina]
MPSCPSGHDSTADDFCDVCGLRLQTFAPLAAPDPRTHAPPATPPVPVPRPSVGEPRGGPCPECGTSRAGRFCEECGYDFASRSGAHQRRHPGARHLGTIWRAVVAADPAYYQYMVDQGMLDPGRIVFPAGHRPRRVTLDSDRVHIGRRSTCRGFTPEIDLGGPGGDPAISHVHAVLVARAGATWSLLDPGSTNGTTVNGTANPITPNVEVPLNDNDRIYVGAWTVIVLQRG